MKECIIVFLGGGIGSILRYLISTFATGKNIQGFPTATFICNLAGCLLIGMIYSMTIKFGWSAGTRLLLTTGLCGGFTTFSTFSYESLQLYKNGMVTTATIYVALSIGIGLLMVYIGQLLCKSI